MSCSASWKLILTGIIMRVIVISKHSSTVLLVIGQMMSHCRCLLCSCCCFSPRSWWTESPNTRLINVRWRTQQRVLLARTASISILYVSMPLPDQAIFINGQRWCFCFVFLTICAACVAEIDWHTRWGEKQPAWDWTTCFYNVFCSMLFAFRSIHLFRRFSNLLISSEIEIGGPDFADFISSGFFATIKLSKAIYL